MTTYERALVMTLFGLIGLVCFLLVWCSRGYALHVEYVEAKTVPLAGLVNFPTEWHATAYEIKNIDEVIAVSRTDKPCKDQNGRTPAMKLCFWRDPARKTELCRRIVDSGYPFHATLTLKVESLCDRGCKNSVGLILEAQDQTLPTGWAGSLWCWVYRPKLHDFVNILPTPIFSDQGEYKIFRNLGDGVQGVIVIAQAVVAAGEIRYGHHRYWVDIYMQDVDGYYKEIGSYRTAVKYPSFEDVDQINVITPELDKIKRFILSKQKKHKR